MSQTRDRKRFTISKLAANWHELMIPQRTMRPSIARKWTRGLQLADIPHTRRISEPEVKMCFIGFELVRTKRKPLLRLDKSISISDVNFLALSN